MRSDLIFGALAHLENRYQLCQLASKATRKLHKPNTRLQDTTNDVLTRFHKSNPAAGKSQITQQQQQQPAPGQQRRAA
jgi:methyltransferase-like protein